MEDGDLAGEAVRRSVLKEDWEILLAILRQAEAMKEKRGDLEILLDTTELKGLRVLETVIK